jgi:hypothetical protein
MLSLPSTGAAGAQSSSPSVFLLSRLLPHARHCFVALPPGVFAAQLAQRGQGEKDTEPEARQGE